MLTIEPPIIAIFGGAFDPPTTAHVKIVRALQESSDVDQVIAVPSFSPPHKTPAAGYWDRLRMCSLAFGAEVLVSHAESMLMGTTYTIDVMNTLPGYGERPYALVLGTDEVRYLPKWKSPAELFANMGMIVVNRPGSRLTELEKEIELPLPPMVRKRLLDAGTIDLGEGIVVSSTEIRRTIGRGNPLWVNLVPKMVEEYVKSHGLYGYREE
jgi:nicotinate-nucleotide adenylyltransferase